MSCDYLLVQEERRMPRKKGDTNLTSRELGLKAEILQEKAKRKAIQEQQQKRKK